MLASLEVGLAFSFRCEFDKKVGYVRGSLRDGDKAIRRRGAVVNRAWLKVNSFVLSTFFERWVTIIYIYNRESGIFLENSTVLFLGKAKPILATLALVTRSTTGVLSGLGQIKGFYLWYCSGSSEWDSLGTTYFEGQREACFSSF